MLERAPPALRLVLLLCVDCGMRSGEAMRIAPAHYHADTKTILFRQKGGTERTSAITERTAQLIAQAAKGDPLTPFAQSLYGHNSFSFAVMQKRWRVLKEELSINPKLHIHDLRRMLATRAYEKTKDLRVAQALLGHQSLASTLRYIAPFDAPRLRPLLEELKITRSKKP